MDYGEFQKKREFSTPNASFSLPQTDKIKRLTKIYYRRTVKNVGCTVPNYCRGIAFFLYS